MKWIPIVLFALTLATSCRSTAPATSKMAANPTQFAERHQPCGGLTACIDGTICTFTERDATRGTCEKILADVGERCGSVAGTRCEPTAFCELGPEHVTTLDASGTCVARPTECADASPAEPVCGNDTSLYPSACHANMAGADIVPAASSWFCKDATERASAQ